jgi:hypothetical protein
MATKGPTKDQKRKQQGTARDGKTNQYRASGDKSVGSHKPGGDGPGTKKFKHESDNRKTQQ